MQRRRTDSVFLSVLSLASGIVLPACAGHTGDEDTFDSSAESAPIDPKSTQSAENEQATIDALNDATAALHEAAQALDEATARANAATANGANTAGSDETASDDSTTAPQGTQDVSSDPQTGTGPETPVSLPQDTAPTDEQAPALPVPDTTESDLPGSPPMPDPPAEPEPPKAPDPLLAEALCTTDSYWRGGENAQMRPGEACVSCHTQEREGPRYAIAGTVYATGHEPDSCNGVSGAGPDAVTVIIIDADGREVALTPNSAGNFTLKEQIALPYTARVVSALGERLMIGPQTVGDCNACHTPEGLSGAPGRITVPF